MSNKQKRARMLREVRAILGAHGVIDVVLAGALCAYIRKQLAHSETPYAD